MAPRRKQTASTPEQPVTTVSADTVRVRFLLESLKCDPLQYQPQSPRWLAETMLCLDIPIPKSLVSEVIEYDPNGVATRVVLTPAGHRFIVKYLENLASEAYLP